MCCSFVLLLIYLFLIQESNSWLCCNFSSIILVVVSLLVFKPNPQSCQNSFTLFADWVTSLFLAE